MSTLLMLDTNAVSAVQAAEVFERLKPLLDQADDRLGELPGLRDGAPVADLRRADGATFCDPFRE